MDAKQQQHAIEAAVERAVLITISGNDHTKTKAQAAPFHLFRNGVVTLSCTGWQPPQLPNTTLPMFTHSINVTTNGTTHKCTLLGFATLPACAAAVADLVASGGLEGTAGWRIGWHQGANDPTLACTVAILSCPPTLASSPHSIMARPTVANRPQEGRGGWVAAAGAPFGALSPRHFGCCVTTGCLSNTIASPLEPPVLLLPDLRVHPGMEGGPLVVPGGALLGILGPPLRQPASAVELPTALPMLHVCAAVRAVCDSVCIQPGTGASEKKVEVGMCQHTAQPSPSRNARDAVLPHSACVAPTQPVVAVVTRAGRWASGIAMANGYILTVAHLFAPHNSAVDGPLRVGVERENDVQWLQGELVYRFTGALDLAIVQVDRDQAPAAATLTGSAPPGTPLWAVGFPVVNPWGRAAPLRPWLMCGAVAAVLRDDERQPGLVLSTCSVQPGSSGGALIDTHGAVVGLLTSNTKHDGVGAVPHLNFAIAAAALEPVFAAARGTSPDWGALDARSESVRALWRLGPEPEARLPAKGSRFEAFVREGARRQRSAL